MLSRDPLSYFFFFFFLSLPPLCSLAVKCFSCRESKTCNTFRELRASHMATLNFFRGNVRIVCVVDSRTWRGEGGGGEGGECRAIAKRSEYLWIRGFITENRSARAEKFPGHSCRFECESPPTILPIYAIYRWYVLVFDAHHCSLWAVIVRTRGTPKSIQN